MTENNTDIMVADDANSTEIEYKASQYTTLAADTSDKEAMKVAYNAIYDAEPLSQHEGETLSLIGVICRPGVRRAYNGEGMDTPCTDTTLICADGQAYFTKSEGIRRCVDDLTSMGVFDAGEPVDVMVVSRQLGGGRTYKQLKLV